MRFATGDADDCERQEIRPNAAAVQNVLHLNDEEEEEEDGDRESRTVTVSLVSNPAVHIQCAYYGCIES